MKKKKSIQKFPTKAVATKAKKSVAKKPMPQQQQAIPMGRPDTPLAETPEPQPMM